MIFFKSKKIEELEYRIDALRSKLSTVERDLQLLKENTKIEYGEEKTGIWGNPVRENIAINIIIENLLHKLKLKIQPETQTRILIEDEGD